MAAPKRGLGKGLSALIPTRPPQAPAPQLHPEGVERHIKIADIKPNKYQPRHTIRDESLTELMQSVKEKGVIERFSLTGRQAILYFREIQSGKPVEFRYRLKAKYPVRAKTPVTTAYQYYEPEIRAQSRPVELVVR